MSPRTLLTVVLALGACTGREPRTPTGAPVAELAVRRVDWNPTHAPLGAVRAVADDGGVVAVLTDHGANVFSAGALVAHDPHAAAWTAASVIPGADGAPRWIVGVDAGGALAYLRNVAAFEDVSARYGLVGVPVRAAVGIGGASVAFLLDHELAIADGKHVARFPAAPLTQLAGGGETVAAIAPDGVVVFRAGDRSGVAFKLAGAIATAVAADGKVYAATKDGVYAADGAGGLALVYRGAAHIHGLVVSGEHVWFADGGELGVLDGGGVAETRGAHVGEAARLSPSPSGDVWVIDGDAVERFHAELTTAREQVAWADTVAPVFARACATCHLEGGRAGVTLSTAASWGSHRAEIARRVLLTRTMPPEGYPLTEGDRAAVQAWVDTPAR